MAEEIAERFRELDIFTTRNYNVKENRDTNISRNKKNLNY